MGVVALILQFLVAIVAIIIPTAAGIHLLSTKGRDAAAATVACRLLQYFVLLSCLEQLVHIFPVAGLLRLLPQTLALVLKLVATAALAHPALFLPDMIVSFCLAHYEEYLRAVISTAEQRVLIPIKQNVQKALDAAHRRTSEM